MALGVVKPWSGPRLIEVEIAQRFEGDYRIRFDEAGPDGNLRPSGFLRYAQDLAWRHSEAAGFDRRWYEERDSFWLVRGLSLSIEGPVGYGEGVVGTTEVTGWRRVWARRHTRFTTDARATLATVDTDWVLLTSAGRPTRIPEELARLLAPGERFRPQKVDPGEAPAGVEPVRVAVRDADVDPLGHLNNAAYLDVVDEVLHGRGDGVQPRRATSYQAEYVRPAERGSVFDVLNWPGDDSATACRFITDTGTELFRALIR